MKREKKPIGIHTNSFNKKTICINYQPISLLNDQFTAPHEKEGQHSRSV